MEYRDIVRREIESQLVAYWKEEERIQKSEQKSAIAA
jgi:hypothetical protein